ncbi:MULTISPECIES: nitrile hydratase accessory protein [Brenneria]|uniref:Nitrile hydratase accessory protein n=1 Tax=Brenneria nigrifluens DSM 30175 = ATCC 13028 TaxID=1121120 RepID=A0A2U1UR91_9GAMM|nr:hypothetical protein BrE312_2989 [Brenneria sp. EniD312]PWC24179.1 nitrile hydratase accessory protein [Brenneria nigrifluens DSM 30175 = ATCC 13028]QCR05370.1 nitrile hydratase accessory protein [Brenneria nigrifluens DSM 30175 = ATCC 13028]
MTTRIDYDTVSLPRDEEGPVFEHPWQAQVFSLTLHLHQSGLFAWSDWVQIFSDEIKASPALPDESVNEAYYRQWTAALEKMVASLDLAGAADVAHRTETWRQAYLNTPHGQPVTLLNADCPPAHAHDHAPTRAPVTISPAFAD